MARDVCVTAVEFASWATDSIASICIDLHWSRLPVTVVTQMTQLPGDAGMADNNHKNEPKAVLSPAALSLDNAARLLTRSGGTPVTREMIQADIDDGAPVNYWKSFCYSRLAVPMGDRGCLSLFGDKPDQHRLFADHITAEYRVKTEGRGRTLDEWKLRPERPDNHWLDCLVGCAVAASIQGAVLLGTEPVAPAQRKRVSFAEMQRRKQR